MYSDSCLGIVSRKQKNRAAYISLPFAMNELTSNLLITAAALSSRRPSPGPSGHLLAPGQAQQHLFFDKDAVPHTLNFGNAPFLRSAWVSCLVSSRLVAFPRKNKRQHWRVHILSLLSGPRALINDMMPSVRLVVLQLLVIANILSTWLRAARRCIWHFPQLQWHRNK